MSNSELVCQGLAKRFGDRAVLTDVNLAVPAGTLTAILGASGSGKTTLLRIVMGFIAPDNGRVLVGDQTISDADRHIPTEKRSIGYVAQDGALFPHLDVAANVGFGLPRGERKSGGRIDEVLTLVGLNSTFGKRRPHELSGGEQRRVALARALAPRPHVVLFDEPFSGLDASLRSETRIAVRAALTHEGTTAVLVTHDQAEALSSGDQVAVLRAGHIVQAGSPHDIYTAPVDLEMAAFLGDRVVLSAMAVGDTADCALGRVALLEPADGAVLLMIRPEQIRLDADSDKTATVVALTYFGRQTLLRLSLTDGSEVLAGVVDQEVPAVGDAVRISIRGAVMAYPT